MPRAITRTQHNQIRKKKLQCLRVCCSPRGYNLNTPSPAHLPCRTPHLLLVAQASLLGQSQPYALSHLAYSPQSYGKPGHLPLGESRWGHCGHCRKPVL